MVKFNQPRRQRPAQATPAQSTPVPQAIQAAVDSQLAHLRSRSICVNVSLDPSTDWVRVDAGLELILAELLREAVARCSGRCELSIWAGQTPRGLEIELADESSLDDGATYNAFTRCTGQSLSQLPEQLRRSAWIENWEFYRTRCPQGGQAWTLVLARRLKLAQVA